MSFKVTVAQLIEKLKDMPQDMEVAYVNDCADEGSHCVTIADVKVERGRGEKYEYPRFPVEGIVVLS